MQESFELLYQPFSGELDNFITLDTETTGFARNDEMIQLGIVDHKGNVLVDTLIKPTAKTAWPHAEKVHNISPQLVAKKGISYSEAIEQTKAILDSFENIVIYNAGFDTRFFPPYFFSGKNVFCAMQLSIPILREFPEFETPNRFLKLNVIASLFDIETHDISLHSAAGDAELTRRVWQYILSNKARLDAPLENIIGEWLFYQGKGIGCTT